MMVPYSFRNPLGLGCESFRLSARICVPNSWLEKGVPSGHVVLEQVYDLTMLRGARG